MALFLQNIPARFAGSKRLPILPYGFCHAHIPLDGPGQQKSTQNDKNPGITQKNR
jgi:hypothetical protein